MGWIYRKPIIHIEYDPIPKSDIASSKPRHLFTEIEEAPLPHIIIQPPKPIKIPSLAHGLERVLFNPGLHPIEDLYDRTVKFTPFLKHIHQPEEIAFSSFSSFIPTSQDSILHSLALENDCLFKGSTSSVGGFLCHLYALFSNFKTVELKSLSSHMQTRVSFHFVFVYL
jgi:hypothetical protein